MKTLNQTRSIAEKDKELLRRVKNVVRGFLPTADVLVYGSVARGTAGPASDYDILVLTDTQLSRAREEEIDDALYELQLQEGVLIAAGFRTRCAWRAKALMPFYQEVEEEAVVL
jgi:predicted nucleotidyltransferase